MKEAANRTGFEVTVVSEGPGSDAHRSASEVENQPALEPSKTPAPTIFCAERITVDAREKD
jgi:hypothetical protein